MTVVLDLDGVVWLEGVPLPGAASAIARLQTAGEDVWFVTNASYFTSQEQEQRLSVCGIDAAGHVLTSSMAAATMVRPGDRVLVCGGPGIAAAARDAGAVIVDEGPADVVLVGFDRAFDWHALDRASAAVRGGARLIGTNADATFPSPDGIVPGGGAILAAVEVAGGVEAEIAGKPHEPMAALVRAVAGPGRGTVVGDRLDSDGALAALLGWDFLLVLGGVTEVVPTDGTIAVPDLVAAVVMILA